MIERYCDPNLPKTRISKAFVSSLMPLDIVRELHDMGIKTYHLGKSPNLSGELAYHPDILVNNFTKGLWICENDAKYLPAGVPHSIFRESEVELENMYPFDCPFNNFKVGRTLVCGKGADHLIKAFAQYEGCRILFVPQNYTKCCTVIVNENAVITSDVTISKVLKYHCFDVLTVKDCSDIDLIGYSHGLIGGCAVNLAPNLIGFTGNLDYYRYGPSIRDFCANHGVDVMSLTNERMYDYGGILPIAEYVPDGEEVDPKFICTF